MKRAVKFSSTGNNTVSALLIILIVCYMVKLSWTSDSDITLDMATNSVDDQFIGCENDTYNKIINETLQEELLLDVDFEKTWKRYNNITNYFQRIIKVYTDPRGSYQKLNNAVSSGRLRYKDDFNYNAYHFFLTRTIQMYQVKNCTDVFRRTKIPFNSAVRGQEIRFGRFASASFFYNLTHFGGISCFNITTCLGADISTRSTLSQEKEVLIPPYEKFKITNIVENEIDCKIIYTLKSAGNFSNMNCELANKNVSKTQIV
ncbi:erythroblast NAD(P)(+)--arginine ADP-ribosyltransferase-like isoform X2 [Silurus meridionalis]|nr:erythroblast NAD(P)(+)--arginine ADP-ribosyltransferase-like isoform X2 [Silurus meridionalis]